MKQVLSSVKKKITFLFSFTKLPLYINPYCRHERFICKLNVYRLNLVNYMRFLFALVHVFVYPMSEPEDIDIIFFCELTVREEPGVIEM